MNYQQLIDSQRYQIESYLQAGFSQTKIAEALGVNKSTISRELKRNSKRRTYNANFAITVRNDPKKEAYKHDVFDANMKYYIDDKLVYRQWSPEQIKGRCDLTGISMVSIERIYQYIYLDQCTRRLIV